MGDIRKEKLLLQNIAVGKRGELLRAARELLYRGGAIATVNPIMLVEGLRDQRLGEALRESLCIPDGVGVGRAFRSRGVYTEVFPGIELCEALLDSGNVSYAIIGGRAGVAEGARDYLEARHKDARCLFLSDGYSYREAELSEKLSEIAPDMALVCLGSPKQELLISRLREKSPKTLFIGLGGTLDVFSGNTARAPKALRKMGLEWLFRMVKEPKRLKKLPTVFDFFWLCRLEGKRRSR